MKGRGKVKEMFAGDGRYCEEEDESVKNIFVFL